jgi:hypothetical protein
VTGTGVYGSHEAPTGTAPGVSGATQSSDDAAIGVLGRVTPTSPGGSSTAVRGINNGTAGLGIGVWGSQAGTGWGVYGTAGGGTGVYGAASGTGTAAGTGLWGDAFGAGSPAMGGLGVGGAASGEGGTGGYFLSSATTGTGYGVWAESRAKDSNGILGYHNLGSGVAADSCCGRGVWGYNQSTQGAGVAGNAGNQTWYPTNPTGVFGSSIQLGLWGYSVGSGNPAAGGYGMYGQAVAPGGIGAVGIANAATGNGIGVVAQSSSPTGTALSASVAAGGKAGVFNGPVTINGDLQVNGTLSKTAGSFKITNPLDSKEWLSHSFVESPDMMNVYNGNVRTNAAGVAVVKLPSYFQALNRDFRYQLTVIGQFAQAIVARKIQNNRFTIRTDKPSVEVSWQVTGIRHDAEANAHRIQVITSKTGAELHGVRTGTARMTAVPKVGHAAPLTERAVQRPRQ